MAFKIKKNSVRKEMTRYRKNEKTFSMQINYTQTILIVNLSICLFAIFFIPKKIYYKND